MFASSNIIYKRIANAYTRCRRITNPTKRLFNVPLDLWSLAKQECFSCKDTTSWTVQSDFPFVSFDKS